MKEYKGKQKSASSMLKGCSYAAGGKVGKTESAKKAEAKKTHKKEVGKVEGKKSPKRMDKKSRDIPADRDHKHKKGDLPGEGYKKGGHVKKISKKVEIELPADASAGAPMSGGPAGPMPPDPNAPPMAPAPMASKKGGRIKRASGGAIPKMKGGAGGGLGRLEKAKDAKKTK